MITGATSCDGEFFTRSAFAVFIGESLDASHRVSFV